MLFLFPFFLNLFVGEKECSNMYFAFRWLIVDFKREFNFVDLMILWEVTIEPATLHLFM